MIELPMTYLNELAKQIVFISTFLGGFSVTLLGALILSDKSGRIMNILITTTAISAMAFIIAVMAMTQLIMISTSGYPFEVPKERLVQSRLFGSIALFLGIFTLLTTISISGWLRSKRMGIITTGLGVFTLIAILLFF